VLAQEATAATREPEGDFARPRCRLRKRPRAPAPAQVRWRRRPTRFLAPLPPSDAKDLKQLLALFDNALFSLLSGGPARPFTQMAADEQDAHLRGGRPRRLAIKRTGFQAMKRLCCAIYFGAPETYASVG